MTLAFEAYSRLGEFRYEAALEAREEVVVLFGHSGAGKSLTLQFIAGLANPDRGRIAIEGRVVFDSRARVSLRPQERGVGYVVQDLALFRHMTVARNIAFGMPRGGAAGVRLTQLLRQFHLQGLEDRRPGTLSGGQQQRVALARALARDARVLLLDEPFSALDESLRAELRRELLRLRSELGLTILFVTHDLREAHLIADRLAVFDGGAVLQFGPREEVFRRPASSRVAELTGVANVWRGRVVEAGAEALKIDVGGLIIASGSPPDAGSFSVGAPVDVMIRAERVNLRRHSAVHAGEPNIFEAAIVEESGFGSTHLLTLAPVAAGPGHVHVEIAARPYEVLGIAGRRRWLLELPPEDLHVVPA